MVHLQGPAAVAAGPEPCAATGCRWAEPSVFQCAVVAGEWVAAYGKDGFHHRSRGLPRSVRAPPLRLPGRVGTPGRVPVRSGPQASAGCGHLLDQAPYRLRVNGIPLGISEGLLQAWPDFGGAAGGGERRPAELVDGLALDCADCGLRTADYLSCPTWAAAARGARSCRTGVPSQVVRQRWVPGFDERRRGITGCTGADQRDRASRAGR